MNSQQIIKECLLENGLKALISDQTRHYFGGYYHVSLLITAEVSITDSIFKSESEYTDAISRMGESISFKSSLEKMAVPADEVNAVRASLLDSFENNALAYLSQPDFSKRFILNEYRKKIKSSAVHYRS
ncbi:MAG TPA: hypothetical protein VGL27_03080 [Negativicutes bacterium]|jgi:hypothetical protein